MRSLSFFVVSLAALANAALAAGTPPINTDDARLALQISAGLAPTASPDVARADVASPWGPEPDGRVSILDALRLLRAANGLDAVPDGGSGLLPLRDRIRVQANTERTYILPRALLFRGRLVDDSGKPLQGYVEVTDTRGRQVSLMPTGSNGDFATGLEPDRYTTRVSASHEVKDPVTGKTTHVTLSRENVETLDVRSDTERVYTRPNLPAMGTVEGRIQGEGFQPGFISMGVRQEDGNHASVSGDCHDGSFRLQAPPGNGYIEVHGSYPGERHLSMGVSLMSPVAVTAGQTLRHDIQLPSILLLQGHVLGASGARVRTVSFFTPFEEGSTTPRFQCTLSQNEALDHTDFVAAVPAGPYEVTVEMDGGEPANQVRKTYRTLVTVPDRPGPLEIRVPPSAPMRTFAGRVVDPSGRPVVHARMSILPNRWIDGVSANIDAYITTDADGRFHVTVPEGDYYVMLEPKQP